MSMLLRSVTSSQRPRSSVRTAGALTTLWAGLVVGLVGCDQIQPVAPAADPITDPTQLYMRLTLNERAITLSVAPGYTTVQLVATPRDANGDPMAGLPAPTFSSSDTTVVRVTADGMVTAVGQGIGTVTASLTAGPLTSRDQAVINVTNLTAPPVLAELSIDPVPPDSASRAMREVKAILSHLNLELRTLEVLDNALDYAAAMGYIAPEYAGAYHSTVMEFSVTAHATDKMGTAITGLPIDYTSLDPTIIKFASVLPSLATPVSPGQTRLVARTMAYGIAKADTIMFTITMPVAMSVYAGVGPTGAPAFVTEEVRIAPKGFVGWYNLGDDSVDVVFDDPAAAVAPPDHVCTAVFHFFADQFSPFFGQSAHQPCAAGNVMIPPRPPNPFRNDPNLGPFFEPGRAPFTSQFRQFPNVGVYPYRSMRTGAMGRVVVTTDPFAD